jgi:hypothetical protein
LSPLIQQLINRAQVDDRVHAAAHAPQAEPTEMDRLVDRVDAARRDPGPPPDHSDMAAIMARAGAGRVPHHRIDHGPRPAAAEGMELDDSVPTQKLGGGWGGWGPV